MRLQLLPVLAVLVGCSETGILHEVPIPELTLVVDSPTYGEFTGLGPMVVTGRVSVPEAVVLVEGRPAEVADDGSFTVSVPYEKPYRILDVTADAYEQHQEVRIPAFAGTDPLLSWPGALTARLTPTGLNGIADLLEGVVDELISEDAILSQIPAIGGNGFTLGIEGIERDPVAVTLTPGADAIAAKFLVSNVRIDILAQADLFGIPLEAPGAITFPKLGVDAKASAGVDDAGGLVFGLKDPEVSFDLPTVELFGLDLDWLTNLIEGFFDVDTFLNDALAGAFSGLENIPLGAPLAFDTDLLGTRIAVALSGVSTDARGVGLSLGVGLNGPVPDTATTVPYPDGKGPPEPDLALFLHDGLLQLLLDSDLLALLEQDLQLPGFLGGFFDPLIEGLPGGAQLPEHNGWCISIQPGTARAARFGTGDAPLGGIYLPDAVVTFGYTPPEGGACVNWLVASLALEVYVDITEGTKLGIAIEVAEGAVIEYGATDVDEDEVIARLGGVVSSLLDLLGGFTSFDLGDILGGLGGDTGLPLDGLQISLGPRKVALDAAGQPIDGGVEQAIGLFGNDGL